jgi:hypothetical protein
MEQYVNENTIVKNDVYDAFKDSIICPICSKIMIEPVICFNCQETFCKNCYRQNGNCPNKCENSNIQDVIGKKKYITKFKFTCIKGCGDEIAFDKINEHYKSNCIRKIKSITPQQAANYKKKSKKKIPHLTSK